MSMFCFQCEQNTKGSKTIIDSLFTTVTNVNPHRRLT